MEYSKIPDRSPAKLPALFLLIIFLAASSAAGEAPHARARAELVGGCSLAGIQKGSFWDKLGLRDGDVILSVNGKAPRCDRDHADFREWLGLSEGQTRAVVKVRRKSVKRPLTFRWDVKEEGAGRPTRR